jgi:HSP20 family protein
MAEGLVRSFGNSDSHRDEEGFGLWREIDRVFDNLARSFGREGAQQTQKGFAREVLAPQHELPEIPLEQQRSAPLPEMPLHQHRAVSSVDHATRAPAAESTFRTFNEPARPEPARSEPVRPMPSHAEEAPRPMQQAKAEPIAPASQPTPIRLNRSTTAASSGPLNPIADAYEDEDNFEAAIELPGVRGEDIDIEFAEGGLNITAERRRATEPAGDEKKHHVRERSFGTYKRRFPVPFQANPDIIRAEFEDGVLIVTVPRPPETKPRVKKIGLKRP